jgi:uncharacterized protein YndB with AHSA1/START domain
MKHEFGFSRKVLALILFVALVAILLVPLPGGETRVVTRATIARPQTEVFDYVTRPANWPKWHPSSLAVSGATDHSLNPGEQVTEDFLVAGHKGRALWTVTARDPPRRWSIDGKTASGGGGTVTYVLAPVPGGTGFEREFIYRFSTLLLRILDKLVFRERIEEESSEALKRLKVRMEAG